MILPVRLCRDCFKRGYDSTAADWQLLLSKDNTECLCCRQQKQAVVTYFKYGEYEVTNDGNAVKDTARHLGLNLNYSFWGACYPYADVPENF